MSSRRELVSRHLCDRSLAALMCVADGKRTAILQTAPEPCVWAEQGEASLSRLLINPKPRVIEANSQL